MADSDMPNYTSPGIYVGEITGARPIAGVGTSTASFVGIADKGPLNKPKLVTSMAQFLGFFGNFIPNAFLAYSVKGFFENGGKRCFVVRVIGDKKGVKAGLATLAAIDEINILCLPDSMNMGRKDDITSVQSALISQCESLKYRFAVLDSMQGFGVPEIRRWKQDNFDSSYAALYYPWIRVNDPRGTTCLIPPSGHIAGIFARSDMERGVHKAPANEEVRGAIELERAITKSQQDILNTEGINCIRSFTGRGILVWGARTTSSDPSWRYINQRRLLIFLEQSIDRGTKDVVFEANDKPLWNRLKASVSDFLTKVWRSGALVGTKPEEAFFVRVGLGETMTQDDLDHGRVVILVGVALLRPAEFVIFRIGLRSGGSSGPCETC
jgi:phage tail sheath protein FI